jgi:protoporphyrinogen IX oxidase
MAGLLYLFRLFVYAAQETVPVVKERLAVMADRLYRFITVPGMGAAFVFGLLMLWMNPGLLHQPWMHAKLFFVVAMAGFTGFGGKLRRELNAGKTRYSSKTLRYLNEVPTLLLVAIVFLVILRPF